MFGRGLAAVRNLAFSKKAALASFGVAAFAFATQRVSAHTHGGHSTHDLVHEILNRVRGIEKDLGIAPSRDPRVAKLLEYKTKYPNHLAAKNFDLFYFDSLSDSEKQDFLRCLNSGVDNVESQMGCYAMQPADYDRFRPFFSKVISEYHRVPINSRHINNWSLQGVEGIPADGVLDISKLGLPALSMRVRVGRNLQDFPLPGAMTQQDRVALESRMCKAFDELIANPEFGGSYHSLTPGHPNKISDAEYQKLVDSHIMFKDMAADSYLSSAGISNHWPYGRGCYISKDRGFIIWVGEEDHLRIMSMKKGTVLNDVFDRLKKGLDTVDKIEGLAFAKSPEFGYVTSCPTNLGTGMRASLHIQLPNLTKDGTETKAKLVARPLGLSVRGAGGEHTPIGADGTVDISPSARFCIPESQIVTALYKGISLLKAEEDKARH
eukprot:gnl/Spiro4/12829_TR6795_c0_g1_i1.p1 gnl/Spiro4/12829_TR6795_c0_g1~~gnl/Spiro4/12829_TR6795_c0_g1_i1.p1  ORF type:complete len:451 (+),score=161.42 gnl/Spiro4/12829_TR6795_c0_g1_i1:47-1354(+)